MPEGWTKALNRQQLKAVTHGDGPLLIIAGAGTGKTRTLAYRVAWLIRQGVPAERILLLTFTRRAAQEMLSRAHALCRQSTRKVWGGTFHAVANRLLRSFGRAVGLSPSFTVVDEGDAADLLGVIRTELGYTSKEKRFPRKATIRDIYSRMVNAQEPLSRVLEKEYPWCVEAEKGLAEVFTRYTVRKQEREILDYDDLLLYWKALLDCEPARRQVAGLFDHVLVDEYQDTNIIQAEILECLRRDNRNITVVGDDAQSIYAFRGATVRNILTFPERFPNTTIVTLEENYRSVQPILDVANAVMESARFRYTKNLWSEQASSHRPILVTCQDEAEQTQMVADDVLKHLEEGISLREQAVLFRAGHHSDMLEVELARRNIPFHKYGGLRFVESAHVKDLLALLRIVENPRDEMSWFRALEMLDGVGPKTARGVFAHLEQNQYNISSLDGFPVPVAAQERFAEMLAALRAVAAGGKMPVAVQVEILRRYYEPLLERLYDNPVPRARDLEQLEQIAQRYRSRRSFITDLALDPPDSTADLAGPPYKDEDFLVLSTMHSAKGCEWKVVYIIHAADGMIPSDMATEDEDSIEEERRLFYVAITRAREWLYVFFPLRYYHARFRLGDRHLYAQLTRFLPAEVTRLFEHRTVRYGLEETVEEPDIVVPLGNEIRRRLKELWKGTD
ncbi:MAG: ATP-dependent helicase [candidate division WOR-3 bacterium]